MFACMKVGYGYRRKSSDLTAIGAEKVYVDVNRDRPYRADLVTLALRPGDTLLLLYLRDLGGSPVADRVWRERVEALGVTVEVVSLDKPPAVMGRPRKFRPSPEISRLVRGIWLDGSKAEEQRLALIRELTGHEVARGVLNHRYGWPSRPKPDKET
jgi:hypothetical protein